MLQGSCTRSDCTGAAARATRINGVPCSTQLHLRRRRRTRRPSGRPRGSVPLRDLPRSRVVAVIAEPEAVAAAVVNDDVDELLGGRVDGLGATAVAATVHRDPAAAITPMAAGGGAVKTISATPARPRIRDALSVGLVVLGVIVAEADAAVSFADA